MKDEVIPTYMLHRWAAEGEDAGCGRENTSGVDPIDQGSAVVDPSARLEARRDGGAVVRAQQQGRVGVQEGKRTWCGPSRRGGGCGQTVRQSRNNEFFPASEPLSPRFKSEGGGRAGKNSLPQNVGALSSLEGFFVGLVTRWNLNTRRIKAAVRPVFDQQSSLEAELSRKAARADMVSARWWEEASDERINIQQQHRFARCVSNNLKSHHAPPFSSNETSCNTKTGEVFAALDGLGRGAGEKGSLESELQ
ncbi:hypothetical protein B0H14DRAFT_2650545 [Mycena olivaceomarginata]|nr:hypothetical protein B0H14DRAFT_2650545 [Mycena olivaceomarginata]